MQGCWRLGGCTCAHHSLYDHRRGTTRSQRACWLGATDSLIEGQWAWQDPQFIGSASGLSGAGSYPDNWWTGGAADDAAAVLPDGQDCLATTTADHPCVSVASAPACLCMCTAFFAHASTPRWPLASCAETSRCKTWSARATPMRTLRTPRSVTWRHLAPCARRQRFLTAGFWASKKWSARQGQWTRGTPACLKWR